MRVHSLFLFSKVICVILLRSPSDNRVGKLFASLASPCTDQEDIAILVSQLGEIANKLARLKYAKSFGALCVCVPNSVMYDESIFTRETKPFGTG